MHRTNIKYHGMLRCVLTPLMFPICGVLLPSLALLVPLASDNMESSDPFSEIDDTFTGIVALDGAMSRIPGVWSPLTGGMGAMQLAYLNQETIQYTKVRNQKYIHWRSEVRYSRGRLLSRLVIIT